MEMVSKVGNDDRTLSAPGDSAPSPSQVTGNVENFKNDLICYCHKLGIPLPVYDTRVVEGSAHAFRFRSTVTVAHNTFTPSSHTFATRKSAAEQDAAKLALQHLLSQHLAMSTNLRLHLRKLVLRDKTRCKMILNEFVAKIKIGCSYETVQTQFSPPVFVSSLALNATCYKGEPGKNKKEAEQLAALQAILSLLDDPTYAASISSVIKSKFNVSAAFNEPKETGDCSVTGTTTLNSVVPLSQNDSLVDQRNFRVSVGEEIPTSVDVVAKNTEEQGGSENLVNKNRQNSLSLTENQSGHGVLDSKQGGTGLPDEAMDNSSCSYVTLPITSPSLSNSQHEMKLAEAAQTASQQISVPVEKQGCPRIMNVEQAGAGPSTEAVTNSYVSLPITSPSLSNPQHEMKLAAAAQSASQQISAPVEKSGGPRMNDEQPGAGPSTEAVTNSYVSLPITSPLFSKPHHGIRLPEAAQSTSQQISVPTDAVTISYVNLPITSPALSKPQDGIILPEAAQLDYQGNSVPMPPAALSPVYDLISSKKRERNKKKANKKKENKRLRMLLL